ncbi:MAG TPA: aldehyde ferredoxin oxidoreductase family protein [Anaerolineae bacterium]
MNRILRVDLSSGRIWDEPLSAEYARQFVGGSGLAARYLADLATANTDPLGPDNPLIFMTGPFVGTQVPAAGRYEVVARSPQTGFTGEANSGGFFGPALRQAGYDGIIVTGRAEAPVYLSIVEGRPPALHPAGHLWSLDSYETQARVQAELGEPKTKVACIGRAGETLVKYAAIMNDAGRAAGRTGMGAVMGSKNLKAIAAFGHAKVPIADELAFKEALKQTFEIVLGDVQTQLLRLGGTVAYTDVGSMYGDSPAKYYTQTGLPEAEETITAGHLVDTILTRAAACYRCPIMCNREVHLDAYAEPKADGPEYETAMGFGPNLGSGDLEAAAYAGHLCNVYGLDVISASSTIGFAYRLFDLGLIGETETGGLALRWGDMAPVPALLHQIACREGFGAQLADGALALGRRYGVPELAVQVKNLEASYHDPRAFTALAIVYAVATRGADHMSGDAYMTEQGRTLVEMGLEFGDRFEESRAKAEMASHLLDWRAMTNSLILCHFEDPPGDQILGLINSVTGWGTDWAEIRLASERIFTLKRMLNHRFGMTRADDGLPKPLLTALSAGGTNGYAPDIDWLLKLVYEVRGYDPVTGVPTPAKLAELGLAWLV